MKAKAIFTEQEKEEAEAYLDEIMIDHPRMKLIHLCKNAEKHDEYSTQNGGWAIASKRTLFYETKHRHGYIDGKYCF